MTKNADTYTNTVNNVIFDISKGLYSFEDIKKDNKLIAFSGRKSTILGKVTQQMQSEVFEDNNLGEIQPKHVSKQFQLQEYISNALDKFERYASIAVANWGIIGMIRSLINYCNGIWLVRKLPNSHKQTRSMH